MSDPAKYRTREEVDTVPTTRDPIEFVRALITKHAEATTEGELKKINACVKDVVLEAAEFAAATPEPALSELMTTSIGRPKLDIDKRRVRRPTVLSVPRILAEHNNLGRLRELRWTR